MMNKKSLATEKTTAYCLHGDWSDLRMNGFPDFNLILPRELPALVKPAAIDQTTAYVERSLWASGAATGMETLPVFRGSGPQDRRGGQKNQQLLHGCWFFSF
jgi:hypothetical protein